MGSYPAAACKSRETSVVCCSQFSRLASQVLAARGMIATAVHTDLPVRALRRPPDAVHAGRGAWEQLSQSTLGKGSRSQSELIQTKASRMTMVCPKLLASRSRSGKPISTCMSVYSFLPAQLSACWCQRGQVPFHRLSGRPVPSQRKAAVGMPPRAS